MHSDVIAAIATGLIPGGIGIVRISGPGAVETAEKITEIKGLKLSEAAPRHLYYGFVRDGPGPEHSLHSRSSRTSAIRRQAKPSP